MPSLLVSLVVLMLIVPVIVAPKIPLHQLTLPANQRLDPLLAALALLLANVYLLRRASLMGQAA